MAYVVAELKAKTVKDLKEIAKELGLPTGGKKDELIGAIVAAQQQADGNGAGGGLDTAGVELEEPAGDEAAVAAEAAPAAASGKHQAIVFSLESSKPAVEKKANIVGVTTLSDTERAQLRAAKFGITANPASSQKASGAGQQKTAAGGSAPSAAGGAGAAAAKTTEEQIKILERGVKYGTASEADKKKLETLRKRLEAQHEKQRLALDKVELADPDKMAAREKKFGKPLLSAKDPKDPEAMKKRAAKFGKPVTASSKQDDEARKKARLERFAQEKK